MIFRSLRKSGCSSRQPTFFDDFALHTAISTVTIATL